jgi:uncharacterized protein (TIGR04206 family)
MWVRSEYAGELAVLSAWLCALLPWSLTYFSGGGVRWIRVHFAVAYFQFAPGSGLAGLLDTAVVATDAARFANDESAAFGYELWLFGLAVLALAVALSLAYYRLDERLEELSPVDPVRVMGGLLVAAAVPLAAATYLAHTGLVGFTVPVGVVFMFVLGGLLLVVERTGVGEDGTAGQDAVDPVGDAPDGAAEPDEDDVSE